MYEYKARVTRVVDGDTIDTIIDLGLDVHISQRIRLGGIDTPEIRGKEKVKGLEAKEYVINKIDGKEILIKTEKKGKFGRYLADIWYDGNEKSLNQELIDNGLAKEYHGGRKTK